ncbi:MAG: hypothetical protein VB108_02860 [Anaerolineaceae bacterium]|nr:hypothetical protein [Anaerolineaceae bacterium]
MSLEPDPTVWDYIKILPERRRLEKLKALEEAQAAAALLEEAEARANNEPLPIEDASEPVPAQAQAQKPGKWMKFERPSIKISWQTAAFVAGMLVYLLTRFIQIDKFPIYFFCDEAIQTMSAVDLIQKGFKDSAGNFLPAYFQNGGQFNLGLSVYWQLIPAMFARSVTVTRAVAALATLVFPLSLAFALKDIFKVKHWWLAPLVIAAIPAWFLHSRTAFETCIGASMFSLFIYFYLKYRLQQRKFLYWSLFFGALAFYAYSPMQMVILVSGFLLLLIDFRYHWQDKATFLRGILLLILLAAPDIWFRNTHQEAIKQHLNLLHSYILDPALQTGQKLILFITRYLRGFDPSYWFFYNKQDLARHLMLNWSHMPTLFLPLVLLGLWQAIKDMAKPENRVLLAAFFAAPSGAALVEPSITRLMMMVVPYAYLTCLGANWLLNLIENKMQYSKIIVAVTAGVLALSAAWMTFDALHNGPTWYNDYTLYGMQWGAQQIFTEIRAQLKADPSTKVIITPSWANNTDVLGRFFLGDPLPIQFNSINSYTNKMLPIDEKNLFVLTPEEVENLEESAKFKKPLIQKIINWPDGRPGFYFLKLQYRDNAEAIFEAEAIELRKPMQDTIMLFGQEVAAEFSRIDMAKIAAAFDNDERSLTRTYEANPFLITLKFPQPVHIHAVISTIGSPHTQIKISITRPDGSNGEYIAEAPERNNAIRPLEVDFGKVEALIQMQISIHSVDEKEPTHVHIWDIQFKE